MPRIKWNTIDFKMLLSAMNFLAIVFFGGTVWATTTGDVASNKKNFESFRAEANKQIEDLRAQLAQLRAQDTSIAVIKVDVQTVKENLGELKTDLKTSVQRIESRIDQQSRVR